MLKRGQWDCAYLCLHAVSRKTERVRGLGVCGLGVDARLKVLRDAVMAAPRRPTLWFPLSLFMAMLGWT